MNERIRQLAEQAQVGSAEFDNDINYFVSTEETFNKFALLIVRECGEVAYRAYWDNPETVKGIHIKEAIREYFGVQE